MKIERILFISFFIILSLSTFSITSITFYLLRDSLENEINTNLERDARFVMEEIDVMMFEQLQNAHFWTQLEVMQEGRIGDIDKQLSQFLANAKTGYNNNYRDLLFVHTNQKVIASSNPGLIGQNFLATENHYKSVYSNGELLVRDEKVVDPPDPLTNILIRVPVYDRYTGEVFAHLCGLFEMNFLYRLLDNAASSNTGNRHIVILDEDGKMISASSELRKSELTSQYSFANWTPTDNRSVFTRNGEQINLPQVVVGYAKSKGYQRYSPMGWSVLVIQNVDQAYFSIKTLWVSFVSIFLMTLFFAFWTSVSISRRIARPILSLSDWVQTYLNFDNKPKAFANVSGISEVRQLGTVFNNMLGDLEKSREQCIKASKLAVVGEMSAIMAHEVRTPLGIMTTAAECLKNEKGLTATGIEITKIILDESDRLEKLVTSLLECARPKAPNMEVQSLHGILIKVYMSLKPQIEKKQQKVQSDFFPNHPNIRGDEDLLKQVFLNILLNAIQITPEKGLIQVSTSVEEAYICIEIADSGPGIDQNDVDRIFDPFFTKRENGIGLGLTVTYQIIQAHQGHISIKKSDLGGACFKVQLPLQNIIS